MNAARTLSASIALVLTSATAAAAAPGDTKADFAVTLQAPATATTGTTYSYEIGVQHVGGDTGSTSVSDRLPSGLVVREVRATSATCTVKGNDVSCRTVELAPGETASVSIAVVPDEPGSYVNTAKIGRDAEASNNTASATTEVTGATSEPETGGTAVPPYESSGATGFGTADATTGRLVVEVPRGCDQLGDGDPFDQDCSGSAYIQQSFKVDGAGGNLTHVTATVLFDVARSFASPLDPGAVVRLGVAITSASGSVECLRTIAGGGSGVSHSSVDETLSCSTTVDAASTVHVRAVVYVERGLVPFPAWAEAVVPSITVSS